MRQYPQKAILGDRQVAHPDERLSSNQSCAVSWWMCPASNKAMSTFNIQQRRTAHSSSLSSLTSAMVKIGAPGRR